MKTPTPSPVVILGAARSGTRLLRAIVAVSRSYAEVPHDVNYLWRWGNDDYPDDELPPSAATEPVRRFVRKRLWRMAGLSLGGRVAPVEKTVSNTLRAPMVDRVIPEALYLHIVRDGRDVAASARRCWTARPDLGRLARKLLTFPWWSCGGYGVGYLRTLLSQRFDPRGRLPTWGPRYRGVDADLRELGLDLVCARQWVRSVEAVTRDRERLGAERVLEVRYEQLVSAPWDEAMRIGEFLRLADATAIAEAAVAMVRPARRSASEPLDLTAQAELDPLLARLGYTSPALARKAA